MSAPLCSPASSATLWWQPQTLPFPSYSAALVRYFEFCLTIKDHSALLVLILISPQGLVSQRDVGLSVKHWSGACVLGPSAQSVYYHKIIITSDRVHSSSIFNNEVLAFTTISLVRG